MTPPVSCPPTAPSGAAPAAIEYAGLTGRQIAQLAADHQAATDALRAPDVTADLTEAAREQAAIPLLAPMLARRT